MKITAPALLLFLIASTGFAQQTTPAVDVSVHLSTRSEVTPREIVPFAVEIVNNGPNAAENVEVDVGAIGFSPVLRAEGNGWVCTFGACLAGRLAAGARTSIHGEWLTQGQAGTLRLEAQTINLLGDTDDSNNHAVQDISVTDTGTMARISVGFTSSQVVEGEFHPLISDTLRLSNEGPSAVAGVVLFARSGSGTGSGWTCYAGGPATIGTICVYRSGLPAGASTTLNFRSTRGTKYLAIPVGTGQSLSDNIVVTSPPHTIPPLDPSRDRFVKFLLPIVTTDVYGSFGSHWTTRMRLFNDTTDPLEWSSAAEDRPDYYYFPGVCQELYCNKPPIVSPHETARLPNYSHANDPGSLLYVREQLSEHVQASIRVADISRAIYGIGTNIPVVRESEFRTGRASLFGVPAGSGYRWSLRVYGPDGENQQPVTVRFFVYRMNVPDMLLSEHAITLTNSSSDLFLGTFPVKPSFAHVVSVSDAFPETAGFDSLRVEIEPVQPTLRFWMMASVTSNDTQQVTIVTP